jgi:hypothetical protein
MKKFTYLLFIFILGMNLANAKPVTSKTAQKVAENFYKLNSTIELRTITLAYTGFSGTGSAAYYVFNINNSDGFVIISADDLARPIIGYATERSFEVTDAKSPISIWLSKRAAEIKSLQENAIVNDAKTAAQWNNYIAGLANRNSANASVQALTPIVQTTWNQSPNYNALCPGGSVTGCVATAMSQIMRFWKFPAHGTGSSSYTAGSYGTLSCNYGSTTYNWSNMPLSIGGANNDVATINYHAGVSVQMNYSPSGSGAYVITSDNPVCAQNSFVTYFGYDPNTIHGEYRASYTDADWLTMIEGDLDLGRPVEYVGWDPAVGGHTWVCDGYDANNLLHMNWGWGGASNGYFDINNMAPSGDNFSQNHEALLGIVPLASVNLDAGIPALTSPMGAYCTNNFNPTITLQNFGSDPLVNCDINYKIDNGTTQVYSWSGSLVTGQSTVVSLPAFTSTSGSHTMTCFSSNPNGSTDANTANDQAVNLFSVTMGGGVLPIVEGFEVNGLPNANWNISHSSTANDWAVTSAAGATGVKSAMIDNTTNLAGSNSILQTSSTVDLSTYTTPALSFKTAYRLKTTSTSEKLQVFVSTDCGATWVSKWARIGTALATVTGTAGSFVPTPSQFTTYTVNIVSVASNTSVMFRWEFFADATAPGNNIYLDDINIVDASTAGIAQNTIAADLNIYPNPSNGLVNVDLSLTEKHMVSVNVTDMLGRAVETISAKSYAAGDVNLTIGSKGYNAGVYMVNINIDGQVITKKVLIN